eukprot:TRINITY_DN8071_c0_g1_i2.p1 TRINITY_DN8071_c0_g1~~TRINITY_DN8071_c0_g1_i2.p1  ORF type:complete len:509 (-),score=23.65 TRINITY_DN8071_c0_g1_i2:103-1629(-)
MKQTNCINHADKLVITCFSDFPYIAVTVCRKCNRKVILQDGEISGILKELIVQDTARNNLVNVKPYFFEKMATAKMNAIKSNTELVELYEKIKNLYARLDDEYYIIETRREIVSAIGIPKVREIMVSRAALINTLEETISRFCSLLFVFSAKKDGSNVMLLREHITKGYIILISLNKYIAGIKISKPKAIQELTRNYNARGPSLIKVGTAIYSVDGYKDSESSSMLYRMPIFSLAEEPVTLAPMKVARCNLATAQIAHKYLYAISGKNKEYGNLEYVRDCEVYDIALNKWRSPHPVNIGYSFASTCTFSDRYIFVYQNSSICGSFDTYTFESYDVLDDERGWTLHRSSELIGIELINFREFEGFESSEVMFMYQSENNEVILLIEKLYKFKEIDSVMVISYKSNHITTYSGKDSILKIASLNLHNLKKEKGKKAYNISDFVSMCTYEGKIYWTNKKQLCSFDMVSKTMDSLRSHPFNYFICLNEEFSLIIIHSQFSLNERLSCSFLLL